MNFVPYPDEQVYLNSIFKIHFEEGVLVRLTNTMVDKCIIDANYQMRSLLKKADLVDYDLIEAGGKNGVILQATLLSEQEDIELVFNFYKVKGEGGRLDKRWSIRKINDKVKKNILNVGDLLYVVIGKENKPVVINLTHNRLSEVLLRDKLGLDPTAELLERITPRLKDILSRGRVENSKGKGKIDPKDVGDTLESLLKVKTNNFAGADLEGLIELKAKAAKTLDTLFTLRPSFEKTPVAEYEKNDRNRVSAFARLYGYESENHPNCKSLYITIGSKEHPQNKQNFYLEVSDSDEKVLLKHIEKNKAVTVAFWPFATLKEHLFLKHPATLWIKAESEVEDGMGYFTYKEIEFTSKPNFDQFLNFIRSGIVTYDWRGYTSSDGPYLGKNHGNGWRIKNSERALLFGHIEKIKL